MKFELVSPWGMESNSTVIEGDTLEEAVKGMSGCYLQSDAAPQVLEAQKIDVTPFMGSENVWLVTGWVNIEAHPQMIFQELAVEVKELVSLEREEFEEVTKDIDLKSDFWMGR